MTTNTRVRVLTPGVITPQEVFAYCASLLGAGSHYKFAEGEGRPENTLGIRAKAGQGLPALLHVSYGIDGQPIPLTLDDNDEVLSDDEPEGWIDVNFDTVNLYATWSGAKVGDLHAWLVRELGIWLEKKKAKWAWQSEFTGQWNAKTPQGNANLGALPAEMISEKDMARVPRQWRGKEVDYLTSTKRHAWMR